MRRSFLLPGWFSLKHPSGTPFWFVSALIMFAGLSCTKETVEYITVPPAPASPAEPAYTIFTAYVVTTQTVLGTGAPYAPPYYTWCANGKTSPRVTLSEDAPYWQIVSDGYAWYRLNPDSRILQVFSPRQFPVDSTLQGIYWWADLHQKGDCVAPNADMWGVYSLPTPVGIDSTFQLRRFLPDGGVKFSLRGDSITLAALDSAKFFARRETIGVYITLPPDTTPSWHGLLQMDTIVVRNFGLLPRKLILFEDWPGW